MDSAALEEVQEVFDAEILAAFLSLTPELAKLTGTSNANCHIRADFAQQIELYGSAWK